MIIRLSDEAKIQMEFQNKGIPDKIGAQLIKLHGDKLARPICLMEVVNKWEIDFELRKKLLIVGGYHSSVADILAKSTLQEPTIEWIGKMTTTTRRLYETSKFYLAFILAERRIRKHQKNHIQRDSFKGTDK
jgi:hypothetical protein